jgi:RNA polymerase sigma factor (sigma-70 family)
MVMFLKDRKIISLAKENNDFLNTLLQSEEATKFIKHAIKTYTKSPSKFMAVNKVEWDDLLQAAYIGLFEAIRKINLSLSPNEWVRYSYLSVQGELRKFSRSNDSNMIVITQRIREMYPKYRKYHEEFWIVHAKDPTLEDTMNRFGITRDDAFELVYGMQEILSQESRKEWKLLCHAERAQITVENEAINRCMAETALDCVNNIQRRVIYLHYFRGFSKTEISSEIGCSNSMVAKHISSAFRNIRQARSFC